MPNWRCQIDKIDRQYSPQIRAFLKGMTSPKLILMLEIESIWSNRHHIAGGIYNFYEDLRYYISIYWNFHHAIKIS